MPREGITIYDLLISCPSDVQDFLPILKESVENFNRTFGLLNNIEVVTKHWSTDSYPESGNKPQELLNNQFVRTCDAAVVIFWTRFGTPTDKYGSGTEEEIEEMLSADKQVFIYFLDAPINPSEVDMNQYKKVKDFKEKYKDRGIFAVINDKNDFHRQFANHLTLYFLSLISGKSHESKRELQPILKIRDINSSTDGYFTIKKNFLSESKFIIEKEDEIKSIIYQLKKNVLPKSDNLKVNPKQKSNMIINQNYPDLNINLSSIQNKMDDVKVDENWIKIISDFAKKNGIELEDDFWNLGNLQSYYLKLNLPFGNNGKTFNGTDEEKERFESIRKLYKHVKAYDEYSKYFRYIDSIKTTKLKLSNLGRNFDEDIDIKLKIPKGCLLTHKELEFPGINIIEYLLDIDFVDLIFSIKASETVNEYGYFALEHPSFKNVLTSNPFLKSTISDKYEDNKEDFLDALDSLFLYKIFDSSESDILIFHIDYLKHNSSMAFPSLLMFKNIPQTISYEITSKHVPEVVKGEIIFKDE